MNPSRFRSSIGTFIDVDNIASQLLDLNEAKKPVRLGRTTPPWNKACYFYAYPSTDVGTVYHAICCYIEPREDPEEPFLMHTVHLQRESKGAPLTIVSGLALTEIPADGIIPIVNDLHQMACVVWGDPRAQFEPGTIDYRLGTTLSLMLDITGPDPVGANSIRKPMGAPMLSDEETLGAFLCSPSFQPENWYRTTVGEIGIVLAANSFANCKNVEVRPAGNTAVPPKWSKAGTPSVRYHEIALNEISSRTTKSASAAGGHRSTAIHVVRGHFAHYTADKPLFGRLVGDFWIPQHARGSAEHGEIRKTYKVK